MVNKKLVKESREKAREYMAEALVKRLNCVKFIVPYTEPGKGLMFASVEMGDILKQMKFSKRTNLIPPSSLYENRLKA